MPNAIALLALVGWPVAAVVLYRTLPLGRALIASLLIAYLFLPPPPAGFDFPLLPPLTKDTIPSLVALALCAMYAPGLRLMPQSRLAQGLVAVFVLSPFLTILTNPEPVFFGRIGLPGLRLREAVGLLVQQAILIAPFLLARNILATPRDQRDIVLALLIGGLVYSLPMLVEIRLSPQLNVWIYGYFQHNFEQMMRADGFRPIVFLYHGLWVAFFAMTALVSAVALARTEPGRHKAIYAGLSIYLGVLLVLCKSLGSLLYGLALVPLVAVMGRRVQLTVAAGLAVLALSYPMLRGSDLVPVADMISMAQKASPDRAWSLEFRFTNEAILLDRAYEKPLFGWGIWGRNHILDENTGAILTVTDGRWVILIGSFGWVGFLAEFGLLTLPILMFWRKAAFGDPAAIPPLAGPLLLMLAINVVDLIPNATVTSLTWLIAGAMLGYAERFVPVHRERPAALRTVL